jgi:serine/threonine protein phosphatase 1
MAPLRTFRSSWEAAPRTPPPGTTAFAIGDMHGQLEHLDALLRVLRPEIGRAQARGQDCGLIMIGDYIDRGPDSLGVLRRLIGLQRELGIPVHTLCGNHDHYLIEFLLSGSPDPESLEAWCGNGGGTTLAELGISLDEIVTYDPKDLAARARAVVGPEILALLRRLELYRALGGYLFVHAGIDPKLPLAEHGRRELLWLREPFLAGRDWRQPFAVVHGHTIRGPEVLRHRVAIDSGAYRTGVLSAVQLTGERLRFFCVTSDPKLKAFKRLPGLVQQRRYGAPQALPALPEQRITVEA